MNIININLNIGFSLNTLKEKSVKLLKAYREYDSLIEEVSALREDNKELKKQQELRESEDLQYVLEHNRKMQEKFSQI